MQIPFRQLITELSAEKMRLALTIIAIAWATTSITFMLAVGEGLRVSIEQSSNKGSDNLIVIYSGTSSKSSAGKSSGTPFNSTGMISS
ncbi:ABC transporter permease [Dongshaea marina]|uniref:ABC transporter permease n=1 Tax=Dongshaea marina TaxID=2047966 RepID=UPI000D3E75E1|nr:ABC transporter permease [Dongshaea marina]